jgi:hypothetical protein
VTRPLAALAALLASLPVTPAAPIHPGAEGPGPYFPTEVGFRWVYQVTYPLLGDQEYAQEYTEVVTAVGRKDAAIEVAVGRVGWEGRVYPSEVVSVSARGLFRVWSVEGRPVTPVCLLKLPARAGDRWDYEVSFPGWPRVETGRMAAEPEKVNVPAGTFRAVRVTVETADVASPMRFWYSPGLGVVKARFGDEVRVLKSFTPGTD